MAPQLVHAPGRNLFAFEELLTPFLYQSVIELNVFCLSACTLWCFSDGLRAAYHDDHVHVTIN